MQITALVKMTYQNLMFSSENGSFCLKKFFQQHDVPTIASKKRFQNSMILYGLEVSYSYLLFFNEIKMHDQLNRGGGHE